MKIGYVCVYRHEQMIELQRNDLEESGCSLVFTDHVLEVKAQRPEFEKLMSYIQKGDTLVIWKLNRLKGFSREIIKLVETLSKRGVNLISLNDPIDTTSINGVLVLQIFCALAEHDQRLVIQQTRPGLTSVKARGRKGGRPKGLILKYQKIAPEVEKLYEARQQTTTQIMKRFDIGSRRTLYKILRFAGIEIKPS